MGERREKLIIAGIGVAAVYGVTAYAICGDAEMCRDLAHSLSTPIPPQFIVALLPAVTFAFFLAIDALLPIGVSAIDVAHGCVAATYKHLFIDGERNNFWHLRIVIALSCILVVQLLANAVECLRGG